jgi:hypothetical protein
MDPIPLRVNVLDLGSGERVPDGDIDRLFVKWMAARVSRRRVLQSVLLAPVGLPLVRKLADANLKPEIEVAGERVVFSIGGVPRWIIDPMRFDGNPKLTAQTSDRRWVVQLQGAWYPGTSICADVTCSIVRGASGWVADLRLPGIGFGAVLPFVDWLLGETLAQRAVSLPRSVSGSARTKLAIEGDALAVFASDWRLGLLARGLARLSVDTLRLSAHKAILSLPDSTTDSLFASPPARRTAIVLSPERNEAPGVLRLSSLEGVLRADPDTLVTEVTSLAGAGEFRALAVFGEWIQRGKYPHLRLTLDDAEGDAAVIRGRARLVRVAASSAPGGADIVRMQGAWAENSFRLRIGDLHAQVGSNGSASTVAAERNGGTASVTSTGIGVRRFVVPLPGADRAVFTRRDSAVGSELVCGKLDSADLRSCGFFSNPRQVDLTPFNLDIRRTADALALTLRFRGVALERGFFSGWRLVAHRPARPPEGGTGDSAEDISAVEFEFASQHLNEQAFPIPLPTVPKVTPRATGIEAGPSRIVFDLRGNSDHPEIPFTLDELFTWSATKDSLALRQRQKLGYLALRVLPFARPDGVGIDVQLALRDQRRQEPISLAEPLADQKAWGTALELPARLVVSPVAPNVGPIPGALPGWTVSSLPQPRAADGGEPGVVELWSARQSPGPMRAVYSPDFNTADFWRPVAQDCARTALDARDRHNIVALTSGFGTLARLGSGNVVPLDPKIAGGRYAEALGKEGGLFVPAPFRSEQLLLTSLGATFKFRGFWDPPSSTKDGALTVRKWSHDAQLRRDSKVVVEYKGFLWPLGHPAVLIKETVRRFVAVKKGGGFGLEARLYQRFFIRVDAFTHLFPAERQPFDGRDLPHRLLRMDALETPTLVDPPLTTPDWKQGYAYGGQGKMPDPANLCTEKQIPGGSFVFWPKVQPAAPAGAAAPDPVHYDFEFYEPNGTRYRAPLLFIDNDVAHTSQAIEQLVRWYSKEHIAPRLASLPQRKDITTPQPAIAVVTNGQLRFAEPRKAGETTFTTELVLLGVTTPLPIAQQDPCDPDKRTEHLRFTAKMERALQPPFYPSIRRARIVPSSVTAVAGSGASSCAIEYHDLYISSGFDAARNSGEVYLRLAEDLQLNFAANTAASGGVASPSAIIVAISRRYGPVGGQKKQPKDLATYAAMIPGGTLNCAPAAGGPNPVPMPPSNVTVAVGTLTNALAFPRGTVLSGAIEAVVGAVNHIVAPPQPAAATTPAAPPPAPPPLAPAAAEPEPDPVAALIQGRFNPGDYFKDAKLLGVVSLADIVAIAQTVTGAQVPTLKQTQLHEIPANVANALRDAAAQLSSTLGSALGALEELPEARSLQQLLAPTIQRVREDLDAFAKEAGAGRDTLKLTDLASRVATDARGLRDTIAAIEADPTQLLPPDFVSMLGQARQIYDALWNLARGGNLQNSLLAWAKDQVTVWAAQQIDQLAQLALQRPEYADLLRTIDDAQREASTLIDVANKIANNGLAASAAALATAMDNYQIAGHRLYAWAELASHSATELCNVVVAFIADMVHAYQAAISSITKDFADLRASIADGQALLERIPVECHSASGPAVKASLIKCDNSLAALVTNLQNAVQGLANPPVALTDCASLIQIQTSGNPTAYGKRLKELVAGFVSGPLDAWQDALQKAGEAQLLVEALPQDLALCNTLVPVKTLLDWGKSSELAKRAQQLIQKLLDPLRSATAGQPPPALQWLAQKLQSTLSTGSLPSAAAGLATSLLDWANALSAADVLVSVDTSNGKVSVSLPEKQIKGIADILTTARSALIAAVDQDATSLATQLFGYLKTRIEAGAIPALKPIAGLVRTGAQGAENALSQYHDNPILANWLAPELTTQLDTLIQRLRTLGTAPTGLETSDSLFQFFVVTLPVTCADLQRGVTEIGDALKAGKIIDGDKVRAVLEQRLLEPVRQIIEQIGPPTRIETRYDWETQVQEFPPGKDTCVFKPQSDRADDDTRQRLTISSIARVDLLHPERAEALVQGSLDRFSIRLFGPLKFLTINFSKLRFTASSHAPLALDFHIENVMFDQDLSFVQQIQDWLNPKSGLYMRLADTGPGVEVGYRFNNPVLSVGAMALQNVGFTVACVLPFDNRSAQFLFRLSDPLNPFLLSVGIYGGGGYVGISARPNGIEYLEASFEYGLVCAFTFGVATGQGRITAGLYIKVSGQGAVLSGFFNACGSASIAGLITLTVAFRVELGYDSGSGNAYGYATFEIHFKIAFISFGFRIAVGYQQKGSPRQSEPQPSHSWLHGPEIIETAYAKDGGGLVGSNDKDHVMTETTGWLRPDDWNAYWDAFDISHAVCEE